MDALGGPNPPAPIPKKEGGVRGVVGAPIARAFSPTTVTERGGGVGLLSILRPVLIAEILGRPGFGAISGAAAVAPILASAAAPSVGAGLLALGGAGGGTESPPGAAGAVASHRPWLVGGATR